MSEEQISALILDLDEYRKKREERGDWPPTREEQLVFFRQFIRKSTKKK